MSIRGFVLGIILLPIVSSCQYKSPESKIIKPRPVSVHKKKPLEPDAALIMKRRQVPVLCYHQIRKWRRRDSRVAKECIIPVLSFKKHIKMLADSGYHTILPDQLYDYLVKGAALPAKPIIISFDDTNLDQYKIGAAVLKKYGFKGVFFVTAEVIGKGHHMKARHLKRLADSGNVIANHTWNHPNLAKLRDNDWVVQLDRSNKRIEQITGKPVTYFAYPYGIYNEKCIEELHKRGFIIAFQLSAARYPKDPLMAVRRIVDNGSWTTRNLINCINKDF